ncbi:unnamed protein product [Allacma fusca]|uniref:Uncharacterized protein n=1 Tax=Allacma fusca TaxID=39272 RepID=A0A8J2L7A3_9HEXA|nr:unnamed protein product [Allacma fusca]
MFSINKPKILDCVPNSVDDPDFKIYDTKVRQGKGSFGSLYGKSECQAWNCSFYVPGKSRFLDMRFGVRLLDRKLTST